MRFKSFIKVAHLPFISMVHFETQFFDVTSHTRDFLSPLQKQLISSANICPLIPFISFIYSTECSTFIRTTYCVAKNQYSAVLVMQIGLFLLNCVVSF